MHSAFSTSQWFVVEFGYQVGTANALQFRLNSSTLLRLVPEEEHALGKFFLWSLSAEHRFERVGIIASIPSLGRDGHGCRSEVLHLLQMEIESFGDDSQLSHILLMTAGMRTDEVRDNLLVESFLLIDAIEDALELIEQVE